MKAGSHFHPMPCERSNLKIKFESVIVVYAPNIIQCARDGKGR